MIFSIFIILIFTIDVFFKGYNQIHAYQIVDFMPQITSLVVEMTKHQDSDSFSAGFVEAIGELVPNSQISLFSYIEFPSPRFDIVTSLVVERDEHGISHYLWDCKRPKGTLHYLNVHKSRFTKLTFYQTDESVFHLFVPIHINGVLTYAIDIASEDRFSQHFEEVKLITRIAQNYYSLLVESERDSLTGLFNRRVYEKKFANLITKQILKQREAQDKTVEERRHRKEGAKSWLAIFDVDHFKLINDRFGYIYGDEVLLLLSQHMQRVFRGNDLIFRFGGEEFVIVFEPIEKAEAYSTLEKFRNFIASFDFPMVGNITISCCFTQVSANEHPKSILDNADKALYYAKNHGRNQTCNFEELLEAGLISMPEEEGDIELF